MNYQRLYDAIILRAKSRPKPDEYTERHHILPKSMGGNDSVENIAILTAREHYLCHWLLFKIHDNTPMARAWVYMSGKGSGTQGRYTSHSFKYAREAFSKKVTGVGRPAWIIERAAAARRGVPISEEQKKKMSAKLTGRKHTPEHCKKISEANKGRIFTPEQIEKIRQTSTGRRHSDETKAMLSELGRKRIIGIHIATGEIVEFAGIKIAAEHFGVNPNTMSAAVRGVQKTCKGYKWKRADKD